MSKLLIVETHPVQYRAPVYKRLAEIIPDALHVAYASDFSVRGARDPGFGQHFAWDGDLLAGYPTTVLGGAVSPPPWSWNSISGHGLSGLIDAVQPQALLLNSLSYRYDWAAYSHAIRRRLQVWMRCETQDHAFPRSRRKDIGRSIAYRAAYSRFQRVFAIGELNRQHWLRHGLPTERISYARYCTPDRVQGLYHSEREQRRLQLRQSLGVSSEQLMIAFFGKLIPKKDPALLISAAAELPSHIQSRSVLVYVGSGELQTTLQDQANRLQQSTAVPTHFAGFVNQGELVNWYLAADVVVLPSRQAGETWGLVVNEALQAGCGVVVSDAVGCSADFGSWARVRTIPVASAPHLADALVDLAAFPRDFDWAAEGLKDYSIEAAAQAFAAAIHELP